MPDQLAIVILNWNGRSLLEQFLPSVVQYSQLPGVSIWVADNGSSDDSTAWLSSHYPNIRTIQNHANLGYAGGYNKALEKINATYFCLLNSDVEVTDGWLDPILQYLNEHPECGGCQPKIRSYHQKTHFEYAGACGGYIDILGYPFCRGRIFDECEEDTGQYDTNREVFWATGACLFIRREAYIQAGGLDDRFFAHMEEIDLCWRLQRMCYSLATVPASVVYHVGGGTLQKNNPRKTFLNFRNNMAMMAKNLPSGQFYSRWMVRSALDDMAFLKEIVSGNFAGAWSILKAQVTFLFTFVRWRRAYHDFEKKKTTLSVNKEHIKGIYNKSIVWSYYINKIRRFSALPEQP